MLLILENSGWLSKAYGPRPEGANSVINLIVERVLVLDVKVSALLNIYHVYRCRILLSIMYT